MATQNLDYLTWRYATKKFDSTRKISNEDLEALLETLRLSPSSFGLEPWKFILVEDEKIRKNLLPFSWNQPQIVDASHLIVLCVYRHLNHVYVSKYLDLLAKERGIARESLKSYEAMINGFLQKHNQDSLSEWMQKQVYLALGFLMSECARRGLDTCPIEGFSSKDYDRILGLESMNLQTVVLCPVGYRSADDKHAGLKKVRFEPKDVILYR